MRANRRKIIIMIMGIIVLCMALAALVRGVRKLASGGADTSQGLAVIQAQEDANVQEIEEKIAGLEETGMSEDTGDRAPKEVFSQSVVMGDSITAALTEYNILNSSSVVAKMGATVEDGSNQLDTLEALNPQVVFLAYGINDVQELSGDSEQFREDYEVLLTQIRSLLPNTRIFVNGIFPVLPEAKEAVPAYEYLEEYNEVLREMCEEYQITYIDNSDLALNSDYEADGVHFQADFYPKWVNRMAEVAAL